MVNQNPATAEFGNDHKKSHVEVPHQHIHLIFDNNVAESIEKILKCRLSDVSLGKIVVHVHHHHSVLIVKLGRILTCSDLARHDSVISDLRLFIYL